MHYGENHYRQMFERRILHPLAVLVIYKYIVDLPPAHWNDENHIDHVFEAIESLELPWLSDSDLEHADWSEVCAEIWAYVNKVANDGEGSAKVDLMSK